MSYTFLFSLHPFSGANGATYLAAHPLFHARTKHIEIYFCSELEEIFININISVRLTHVQEKLQPDTYLLALVF